jgi:hypothetical protein
MNAKTKARMVRISGVLERVARQLNREIKAIERLKHPKPEDVHAFERLEFLCSLAATDAEAMQKPRQTEIPIP